MFGKLFDLVEGDAGMKQAALLYFEAGKDAAEGVGGCVSGVYEYSGAVGYVGEVEFVGAEFRAVVKFEAVGIFGDGGVCGVVEGVARRMVGRFECVGVELVPVQECSDCEVFVVFFADEYEGV